MPDGILRSGLRPIPGQPAGVHDVLFRADLPPASDGRGPFLRQLPGRQAERLGQGHGIGKDRAATVHAAEAAVQAPYGAGSMDSFFLADTAGIIVAVMDAAFANGEADRRTVQPWEQ